MPNELVGGLNFFPSVHSFCEEMLSVKCGQVRSGLGYCPQFDAVIDLMTGRETLYMFARLRGIRESCISPTVQKLLSDLLLHAYADRLIASYR